MTANIRASAITSGILALYAQGDCKPEGIAVELCDAIMRILDFLAFMGVDVEAVLMAKHEYNKGRAYRHGGKRA